VVVFSIFEFSGWESTGPMAEESKNPRRNVPIGLVGSVIILMIYFVFSPFTSSGPVFWGLLVFFAIVVVTIAALAYMRARGLEEWMAKAQLVFEQSGSGH
jgi:amino acid transporter